MLERTESQKAVALAPENSDILSEAVPDIRLLITIELTCGNVALAVSLYLTISNEQFD